MKDLFARDSARTDQLILVDGLDRQTGVATKEEAHRQGLLHRAFSVVLVRDGSTGPELLLAQRAAGKYHSAGLWANSCCSHPRDGEEVAEAARRRTREELGVEVAQLAEVGAFAYRAVFDSGLVEYEYDHVLIGRTDDEPDPDPTEVAAVRWESLDAVAHELAEHPERFAAWAYTVLTLAAGPIAAACEPNG